MSTQQLQPLRVVSKTQGAVGFTSIRGYRQGAAMTTVDDMIYDWHRVRSDRNKTGWVWRGRSRRHTKVEGANGTGQRLSEERTSQCLL